MFARFGARTEASRSQSLLRRTNDDFEETKSCLLVSSERTDLSALEYIPCRERGDMAWGEDGAERVPPIRREEEAVLR